MKFIFFSSGSLSTRIIGGILVEVAVFVLTVVLAMLESSQWPGAFFWTTMGSVVILNSKFFFFLNWSVKDLNKFGIDSGWWNISKYHLRNERKASFQVYRSGRPWLCKFVLNEKSC